MIGRTLAHYRIESRLGAGGMGEVYLAEDTRLRRKVALKLLPTDQIGDPERLRRFEQEAHATSALNHPNTATIFETGDADDLHYITIEYIEGRTLRVLLEERSLDLRRTLDIAVQVADGLAAAHEAKVVHRDLKPENIMVRNDGIVKILDFGLAKLSSRLQQGGHDLADDETIVHRTPNSSSLTDPGMVLGTVSYMSPEQARGEEVDYRSDIFSFGSILYEALARQRPFKRPSSAETMAAIIQDTPPPLQERAPETPPEFARIIRKAMAKDANERYQSGRDLALDLRALRREVESGSVSAAWAATSGGRPAVPARGGSRRRWLVAVLLAAGIVAVGLPLWNRLTRPPAPPPAVTRSQVTTTGTAVRSAIGPQGRILAWFERRGDRTSLWIRQIGAGTDAQIFGPTDRNLEFLTFTPDGEWLLFSERDAAGTVRHLRRIAVVGGAVRDVLEDIDSTPSFAPDGNRFVFMRAPDYHTMQFVVASLDKSVDEEILYDKPAAMLSATHPTWSPDGGSITFIGVMPDGLFRPALTILDIESGRSSPLSHPEWVSISGLCWKPDGSGLYVTAQKQWQSKSHVFLVPTSGGEVRNVTSGFDSYVSPSLTADGRTLAVTRNSMRTTILSVPSSGTAQENTVAAREIVTGTGHSSNGSYAPDGARIVYVSSTEDNLNLWTMDPDGGQRRQLTFDLKQAFWPRWSPDGAYIAYGVESGGNLHLQVMDADGRNARQVTRDSVPQYGHAWGPDSRWLSFLKLVGVEGHLYKVAADGSQEQRIGSLDAAVFALWSPDGEWLLTWRNFGQGRSPELTMVAADGSDRTRVIDTSRLQVHIASAFQLIGIVWGRDSETLYAIRRQEGMRNIVRLRVADGAIEPLTAFTNQDLVFSFSVSPDETQLAVTRGVITNDIVLIEDLP